MSLSDPTAEEQLTLRRLYAIFHLKENYFNDVRLMKVYRYIEPMTTTDPLDVLSALEAQLHGYRHEDTFGKLYRIVDAAIFSKYETTKGLPVKVHKRYLDY